MRVMLLLLAMAGAAMAQDVPAASAGPLEPLRFLLGTWTAKAIVGGGSARGEMASEYTFHTDLNGTVVTRSTTLDTCVAPQAFSCQHHDLLTIYRDPKDGQNSKDGQDDKGGREPDDAGWRAISFDREGHTLHYRLTFPDAQTAVFLSTGPGQQTRLVYHLAQGVMSGKLQFAPAGGKVFKSYVEWAGGHPTMHEAASAPINSSIDALRDTTRILLVFAANSSDAGFARQYEQMKGQERGMMDRTLILVPVLGHWSRLDSGLYEANLPFSLDKEQEALRTRFKVGANSFTVILVGKDGGEKMRSHTPLAATSLFETVDSMPMRQVEMKGARREPKKR